MSGTTRPWIGWLLEYPEEGCVWVDAHSKSAALRKVADSLSESVENVVATPATAQDVELLLDEIETLRETEVILKTEGA